MSPFQFRPHVRLPWQVLAGIAAAAYLVRAALRGWDFSVSVLDALVFAALALILVARPLIAHLLEADAPDGAEEPPSEGDGPVSSQQSGAEGEAPQDE